MTELIYLDNSATTKVSIKAMEAANWAMGECYGNPSSAHAEGARAAHALADARSKLLRFFKDAPGELIFNSGGSEGNTTVILGIAASYGKRGRRILVSSIEHPSVLEPAKSLKEKGFDVRFIPVDKYGIIDLGALEQLLTEDVILTSVQHVNNETGAIQPLLEIGKLCKAKAPQSFFHVDGVQSFAKLPLEPAAWQMDLFTASGHKIHAPKGVGLLWFRKNLRLPPLIYGGGQEKNLRSGTENMPGIMAFAEAAGEVAENRETDMIKISLMRYHLLDLLGEGIADFVVNSPLDESGLPYVLNISFPGVKSEVLLHYLEDKGVCVSAGSACHSSKKSKSHVLEAMGLAPELVNSAIRFSFSAYNTITEIEKAAQITIEAVSQIRDLFAYEQKKKR